MQMLMQDNAVGNERVRYILCIKSCTKLYTNMNVRTHLIGDGLTSRIFRVHAVESSITLADMYCGFQREANRWLTGLKGCVLAMSATPARERLTPLVMAS